MTTYLIETTDYKPCRVEAEGPVDAIRRFKRKYPFARLVKLETLDGWRL